ncbi:MAG: UPF0149 family protein [Gammaproteobacteria bacterium]|nr:MAG: UPF0149 family protein [Gammaproteobacteria bacterium]
MDIPDYQQLTEALERLNALKDAAEAQGIICGMLCAHAPDPGRWMMEVLPDADTANDRVKELHELLGAVYMDLEQKLGSSEFSFNIVLPDDDEPVKVRTVALGQWCLGLLLGLGMAGMKDTSVLSADAREVLNDVVSLSRAGQYDADDSEENEKAFMQLVEFARVAAQLLYEELRPDAESPAERG